MRRKLSALFAVLTLILSLCGCGSTPEPADTDGAEQSTAMGATAGEPEKQTVKVGLVCIGDENDESDTYNFIRGKNDASVMLAADGINVEWVIRWNIPESGACEDTNRELAREGCQLIFNTSPGFETFMRNVAPEYPDTQFVACGGRASWNDELPNTHNAFANIHEGRYLAGVVGGMKLQELMDAGELAPDKAVIGYVGTSDSPEVISAYSAYFLGARSVCPGVTMKVSFVGAWPDGDAVKNAASALAGMGCTLISQQSDGIIPAAVAQSVGILHTGYNHDVTAAAPKASLTSTRIDWSVYFEYAIRALLNGEELAQDWCHGLDRYAVELTPLNRDLIADGTDEQLDKVKAALADGSLQVFDVSAFTVDGEPVTHASALDTDGDLLADSGEAVFDGAFHESYFQSAPCFALNIDGIEKLN